MSLNSTALNWLQGVSGYAVDTGNSTGIDPSVILGQAALESGYGQSGLATQANNLFGIKGVGDAGSVTMMTNEVINGVTRRIPQNFAAYSSPAASFAAYGQLLSGSRYAPVAAAGSVAGQISALANSGYATATNYKSALTNAVNAVSKSGVLSGAAQSLASKASSLLGNGTVAGLNAVVPGAGSAVAGFFGIGGQKSWLQQFEDWIASSHFFQRLALAIVAFLFIFAAFYLLGSGQIQKLITAQS